MTTAVRVVESVDQRRLLDDVLAAIREGRACAVLDPTWPAGVRANAGRDLQQAEARGRLGRGDLVVFTSGSTARPRGVIRTVASWRASAEPLRSVLRLDPADVVWTPGPLWSSLYLYAAWHATTVGLTTVLRDDDASAATVAHCVPGQLPRLLDLRSSGRLPRLRTFVVAGDRTPAGARTRCEQAGVRLLEYYGAAELSFVGWRDDYRPLHAFPGVEVDVRDAVLWARSTYIATTYLSPDDGGPLRRDDSGWATVGDLAVPRAEGFEVIGRGDAAVTTGGHTVVVEDVERMLLAVPGVVDAGVLGLPHPRLGQLLVAVVVGDVDDARLRTAARRLPAPARPRRWLRATRLPRTEGGKLRRQDLAVLAATLAGR